MGSSLTRSKRPTATTSPWAPESAPVAGCCTPLRGWDLAHDHHTGTAVTGAAVTARNGALYRLFPQSCTNHRACLPPTLPPTLGGKGPHAILAATAVCEQWCP